VRPQRPQVVVVACGNSSLQEAGCPFRCPRSEGMEKKGARNEERAPAREGCAALLSGMDPCLVGKVTWPRIVSNQSLALDGPLG
jgi:hypothetical protein